MEEITLQMLVDTFKTCSDAGKRFCFILGAGASKASGIKTGAELATIWLKELKEKEKHATQEWIRDENIDEKKPGVHYPEIYERRFRVEPASGFIRLQKEMGGAIPSPGYYHLARILVSTNSNLVITTNFDSLTEDALFFYEDKKALVITHESLAKYIDVFAERPTVIKLHRDLLLQPINSKAGTKHLPDEWKDSLKKIMGVYVPIVIGYGGNDGSLMEFLESISDTSRNIYWCYQEGNPINQQVRELLEKYRSFLISIDNFDYTMQAFGEAFNFAFSEDIILKTNKKRTKIFITKYRELTANRSKALIAKETLSNTESMTPDHLKSLKNSNINSLESLIVQNPQRADYHYSLGNEYFWDNQYDKAIECFNTAIGINPDNADSYNMRGISYNNISEFKKAIEDQTKAIELNPDEADFYYMRGISYNWLKEYANAVEDQTKAIELNPDEADFYQQRGVCYCWLNEYEKAIADQTKAIELNPNNAECYYDRGIDYSWLKEYEKAIADFSKAIEYDNNNAQYYAHLARTLCRVGDTKGALENVQKAMTLDNDLVDCYNVRGFINIKIAKRTKTQCTPDVLDDLNKAIKLAKDESIIRCYADRTQYYLYVGDYENAYSDIKKMLTLDSNDGRVYFFLAQYYRAKGDTKEYENCLAKSKEYKFIPDEDD
jgi:tetratricopeptide (TPR) repeat protein